MSGKLGWQKTHEWLKTKKGRKTYRTLLWVFFALLSTLIMSINLFGSSISLKEGEIATQDIYYEGPTVTYTSEIRTDEMRNQAASQVEKIYRVDSQVLENLKQQIETDFDAIYTAATNNDLQSSDKLKVLRESLVGTYSDAQLRFILEITETDRTAIKDGLIELIANAMQPGVLAEQIDTLRQSILDSIKVLDFSDQSSDFLTAYFEGLHLEANKTYDAAATTAKIEKVMRDIAGVQVTVLSGEKIISRGYVVTAEQVEKLQYLGLQTKNFQGFSYLGLLLFMGLLYFIFWLYIRIYLPETRSRQVNLILIGVLLNLMLLICKLISLVSISDKAEVAAQIGFLLPVAAFSMLFAVLMGRRISIFATIIMGICVGVIMHGELSYAFVAIIGGIVGVFSTHRLNQRGQFVGSSVYIAAANVVAITAWGLLWDIKLQTLGVGILMGVGNGILSAILTTGILPFLENLFRITTIVRLLELSNFNHPLLKRLMMEAPGTYHHSILVGNLAEAAADAIGANALLVRVASYYHDIGKLKRPYFFIENQLPGENPHDKLAPTLSTLLITSHVKEGVEMLEEAKLPKEIIEIVREHHGTGILPYFYHKAQAQATDPSTVKKEDFAYPGPRPQTREAALVLLADSVQAAVQSISNPTKAQIEAKVKDIINIKEEEGQLFDCHLTFKDLGTIAQAFVMVLSGINHSRIDYPEEVLTELGGDSSVDLSHDPKSATTTETDASVSQSVEAGGQTNAYEDGNADAKPKRTGKKQEQA